MHNEKKSSQVEPAQESARARKNIPSLENVDSVQMDQQQNYRGKAGAVQQDT